MIKSVKDLKAYEDVFTLIDECTDNYVFVYDLENDLFHISKSALDTFTLEEEHIKLASSALKPLVYPKDWDRLAADIRAVRNQEKAQHNLEYRLITKDDEIIWVSGKSRTFFNENGEPFMLIGCICEIGKHNKYDNITSLYCEDVLKERYALAKIAEPQPVTGTILLIGIDNFREINEKYGTKMGNILLAGVAEAIAVCCKDRENVFRFHGDEFAVILKEQPSCTTADAKKLYKTIRRKIDSSIEKNGYHMFFTISGGAASFNTQEDSYEDVLKNAKFALHVSKLNGKNTFTPYSEDEYLSYIRRIDIQEELRKCVENDYTFTADSETMKVEVAFTFDATSLDGKQLVTFEELYDLSNPDEPKKVTEHKDIEDKGQTITFKEKPEEPEKPETPPTPEKPSRPSDSPKTGDNTNLYGLLALLMTSGAGLAGIFFYKRRKMKKS